MIVLDKEFRLLDSLNIGEKCIVKDLTSSGKERRRMLDLGLIKGTKVEAVLKNPTGDLTAYYIRGALIALRSDDSSRVVVCSI